MRTLALKPAALTLALLLSGAAHAQGTPAAPEAPAAPAPQGQDAPASPELKPPSPLAVEAAAYVYAAANICGFRIDPAGFDRLLAQRGSSAADLRLQGPFGGRIRTRFVMLSNGMAQNREAACGLVWREIGAEGTVERGVVLEAPPAQ